MSSRQVGLEKIVFGLFVEKAAPIDQYELQ